MNKFGPTIGEEMIAAGLGQLGLTFWHETGKVTGFDLLDAGQQAAVLAVINAHDPMKKPAQAQHLSLEDRLAKLETEIVTLKSRPTIANPSNA